MLQLAKRILGGDLINNPGRVIYNSVRTLKPSRIYVAGLNPGGSRKVSICNDINDSKYDADQNYSALDLESWRNHKPGEAPYQKRAKEILRRLGYDHHDVFLTNALFCRSRTSARLSLNSDAISRFGRMHLELLAKVTPEVVLCLGNGYGKSSFRYFQEWAEESRSIGNLADTEDFRDGKFREAMYPGIGPIRLVGVPHPSRFSPTEQFYYRFQRQPKT